jgi:hypothetical protein
MRSDTAFVRAHVEPLLVEVSEQRRRFVEGAEAEVDAVRSHSVVRDLERALLRLENELRHLTAGRLDKTSVIRPLNAGEAASRQRMQAAGSARSGNSRGYRATRRLCTRCERRGGIWAGIDADRNML